MELLTDKNKEQFKKYSESEYKKIFGDKKSDYTRSKCLLY